MVFQSPGLSLYTCGLSTTPVVVAAKYAVIFLHPAFNRIYTWKLSTVAGQRLVSADGSSDVSVIYRGELQALLDIRNQLVTIAMWKSGEEEKQLL